jgi:hypothetical protein
MSNENNQNTTDKMSSLGHSRNTYDDNSFEQAHKDGNIRQSMFGKNTNHMKGAVHCWIDKPAGSNKTKSTNRQKPRKRRK